MLKKKKKEVKIFCIGFNKTGTTSLEKALTTHGFKLGDQRKGELLLEDWSIRNFESTIKLSYTADAFQDTPFSLPFTYIALDNHFPNAKFILTIRDSSKEWYDSLIRFHLKIWGKDQDILSAEDLKQINYVKKGWAYLANKAIFDTADNDVYNEQKLCEIYERHNADVIDYFKTRPEKLLVLNLKNPNSYKEFCSFLNEKPIFDRFPTLNSSK